MTDISTIAPIATPPPRPATAKLSEARNRRIACRHIRFGGDAFKMSYVDPYTSHGRRPQVVPDDDLEGRDPTW